jgi:DNA-binding HxlR family transcriptional regulator
MPGGIQPAAQAPFGFAAPAAAVVRSGRAAECWTVTAADVDAWLEIAMPGERFVYAHGPQLVQGGAAGRVGELARAGDVTPHNRRTDDGGFDFFVLRTSRARTPINREPVCTPHMVSVLVAVQEDAQLKRRCRSDSEIGAAVGITADQVKWQLRKLEEAKFIVRTTVPTRSDSKFRVITVTATGQSTAGPEGSGV